VKNTENGMIKWKPQKTKNPHWQAMPLTSENTFATTVFTFYFGLFFVLFVCIFSLELD